MEGRGEANYLLDEIKCYEGSHILDSVAVTVRYWSRLAKEELRVSALLFFNPWFTARLIGKMIILPFHTLAMLACLARPGSWAWQFKTEDPPTRLLRQTWKFIEK